MSSESINTFKKLDVPPQLVTTMFVLIFIFCLAPYVGGVDFGIAKIPNLSPGVESVLKWISPIVATMFLLMFFPFWQVRDREVLADPPPPVKMSEDSKYILQRTPDIILNEIQKNRLNADDINIVRGFNVNDLIRRLVTLNPENTQDKLIECVIRARKIAFTSKYADPREDEKLVDLEDLHVADLRTWESYLTDFLGDIGIFDFKNLNVLDVGIGNAWASHSFLSKLHNLTGVDVSNKALDYAKAKLPNANLVVGAAENLNMIDSFSVDLYVSLRTYQSTLFDIKQSIHEAYRVLAKGGGIVITIPIMFLVKDKSGSITGTLQGLIPSGSTTPSIEYANEISARICWYLELLGFTDYKLGKDSPFEIFIGARK